MKAPRIRYYTVKSKKIVDSVRLVLLSDLHGTQYGDGERDLAEAVASLRPSAVALVGDLADCGKAVVCAEELVSRLSAPCFAVLGNHEFSGKVVSRMEELFRAHGVKLLRGGGAPFFVGRTRLLFVGLDDPFVGKEERRRQIAALPRPGEAFSVLLSHRPDDVALYEALGYDLVLCGHTHGGQIRLPHINGLYAPGQGLFPRYAGGRYEINGRTMIVGRGLVQNALPRWGNPAEIPIVDLQPEA